MKQVRGHNAYAAHCKWTLREDSQEARAKHGKIMSDYWTPERRKQKMLDQRQYIRENPVTDVGIAHRILAGQKSARLAAQRKLDNESRKD